MERSQRSTRTVWSTTTGHSMAEQYKHEEIRAVPRGYKVRTIRRGKHEIRVAFPPGRRQTGSGEIVSILHPVGENPHCHVKNIFLKTNPAYNEANVRRLIQIHQGFRQAGATHQDAIRDTLTQYHASDEDRREYKRRVSRRGFGLTELGDLAENPTTLERKRETRARAKRIREAAGRNPSKYVVYAVRKGGTYGQMIRMQFDLLEDAKRYAKSIDRDVYKKPVITVARDANPFDWREQREHGSGGISHGDRVTFVDRFGKRRTGRAVMRGPAGWVLNMGGAHGTPQVVREEDVVSVRKSNPREQLSSGFRVEWSYKPGGPSGRSDIVSTREHAERLVKHLRTHFSGDPGMHLEARIEEIRRNPDDDELGAAERLYEEFHGREPREILELQESDETRGDFTALGELVELTIVAPNGDTVQIQFKGDGVRVASSPDAAQLYLIGGNQDISGELRKFGADESKDLVDLGEAKQIVYEAAKWQTDFTAQEWKHDFGEKSGVRPRAFFDQLKKRIFFAGGTYKVKRPGIID
jgi:hypothetical protein